MLTRYFFSVILLATDKPTNFEKLMISLKVVATFAPLAYVLNGIDFWFATNHVFFSFMLWTLVVNMVVGVIYHHSTGTFSWKEFWSSNIKMWVIIILVYPLLEMLSILAGANFAGEAFKIAVQINTLLYPASKILKNIYLWSDKKYPPEWIMERIYKFEKTGKIDELTKPKDDNENQ